VEIPDTLIDLNPIFAFAHLQWKNGEFRPAAVGRGAEQGVQKQIRSDSILWLENHILEQLHVRPFLGQIREQLNRELYIGIQDFEAHLAHYAEGQAYQEHLDQPNPQSFLHGQRLISFVLYLNSKWEKNHGGQLQIRQPQTGAVTILEPRWGQLVLFRSDLVWHQVLPSRQERWSLTGWFRRS
jgi:SM-20-related protein